MTGEPSEIQRIGPSREVAPGRRSQAVQKDLGARTFESLLGRLMREVQSLEAKAVRSQDRLAPEVIKGPEDLESALREAGRNFRSCMKLSKNLIAAYEATVKKANGPG